MPTPFRFSSVKASGARSAGLLLVFAGFFLAASPHPCDAQVFEATGQRALGMGGAFVAVADDATATYWNPAGLATGATVDACLADGSQRALAGEADAAWPASETAATPSAWRSGLGLQLQQVAGKRRRRPADSPYRDCAGRPTRSQTAGAGVSTLDTRQVGVTLVQSVWRGLAVGGTLKYVRGRAVTGEQPADLGADALLEQASSLPGLVGHAFDADIGAMLNAGSFRAGVTVRNLLAPEFETGAGGVLQLHRQARVGVAVTPGTDAAVHAAEDGWIVAVDADLTRTPASAGDRRMIAAGAGAMAGGPPARPAGRRARQHHWAGAAGGGRRGECRGEAGRPRRSLRRARRPGRGPGLGRWRQGRILIGNAFRTNRSCPFGLVNSC